MLDLIILFHVKRDKFIYAYIMNINIKYSIFLNLLIAFILLIISFINEKNSKKFKNICKGKNCPNFKILLIRYFHYILFTFACLYLVIYPNNFYTDIFFLSYLFLMLISWTFFKDCKLSTFELNEYKKFGVTSKDFGVKDQKYLHIHYLTLNLCNNEFILFSTLLMIIYSSIILYRLNINIFLKFLIIIIFLTLIYYNLKSRILEFYNKYF